MKTRISFAAALSLGFVLACTDPAKIPAEAALQAADTAVASLGDVAAKYVPEQTQELQKALADAKELAAKKEYKAALAAATGIPERAKALLVAANAKKDELLKKEALSKAFGEISGAIPSLLADVKSRIDALSQAKKLPAGITKAAIEQAKAGAAEVEAGLAVVTAQAQSGDLEGAVAKANELQTKGLEIMKSIAEAK